MKTHRFIGNFDLKAGPLVIVDEELVHQIWDVLKLRSSERIMLCDGHLNEALATISARDNVGIAVIIESVSQSSSEPPHSVTLYCAILKKENFELVCQKATEAGVAVIVPVITERTVKLDLRYDRLEKIIREAAEQSGRGHVPALTKAMNLDQAFADSRSSSRRILFDVSGEAFESSQNINTAIFIGPEGGWSATEIQKARAENITIATLGPLTLRGETAAIIATYLVSR